MCSQLSRSQRHIRMQLQNPDVHTCTHTRMCMHTHILAAHAQVNTYVHPQTHADKATHVCT